MADSDFAPHVFDTPSSRLSALLSPLSETEVVDFYHEIDRDNKGFVTFSELTKKLEQVVDELSPASNLRSHRSEDTEGGSKKFGNARLQSFLQGQFPANRSSTGLVGQRLADLPTWIPDWRLYIPNCPNPLRAFPGQFRCIVLGRALIIDVPICGIVSALDEPESNSEGIKVETNRSICTWSGQYPAVIDWANGRTTLQDGDLLCLPFYSFRRGTLAATWGVEENKIEQALDGIDEENADYESELVCLVLRQIREQPLTCKVAGLCPTRPFRLDNKDLLYTARVMLE